MYGRLSKRLGPGSAGDRRLAQGSQLQAMQPSHTSHSDLEAASPECHRIGFLFFSESSRGERKKDYPDSRNCD